MNLKERGAGLLLIIGLICGSLGQFYFAFRREYVWDGVLLWGIAILSLSLMMWRLTRRQRGEIDWQFFSRISTRSLRTWGAIGAVGLSLAVGWRARERPPTGNFSDLLGLWVVGVAAYLLIFTPPLPAGREIWPRLRAWLRRNVVELAGVTALLLVALVVRAYNLEHIPANLGGDEGTWALEGLAMLDGRLANPFATRWFAFPSMSFLVWGLSMRLFGETVAGVRAVSALIGTASVLSTFLLARELWGQRTLSTGSGREAMDGGGLGAGRIAWFAAGALAVGHYHIHFSRLAVNNIADTLFVTLSLYLLMRGLQSDRSILFALAGALIGAGWYGYFGARLVGIIAALYVIWRAVVEDRFLAHHGYHLLILLGAGLVVAAPLLLHYAAHPSTLSEGVNRVSIMTSGWLAREQEATGRSAMSLLLEQFWKSISAFNYTLDPTFWYRARIPLLDVVSGLFFVFGLIWCTARAHRSSNGLLLIWFWSALATGWVMTENPPSSQRLVIAAPALALFVALGLDRLLHLTRHLLGLPGAVRRGIAGLALLGVVGLNLGYYFFVYIPSRVYGNPTAEMTTHLARYLARQNDECVVYLHGPPFVYWDFGTLRFMARGITGVDMPSPDEGGAPEPDLSRGACFVFHPARADELATVRAQYPGGQARRTDSRASGELLYAVYEVGQ